MLAPFCRTAAPTQALRLAFAVRGRKSAAMTASIHRIGRDTQPSLDPLMNLIAEDLNSVNAVILDRMQSRIPLIPELAGHLIAGGGKRMRPMLTLACAG
jgi:octaprenyl-diphosphate synthase